jgi:hypothetical protein
MTGPSRIASAGTKQGGKPVFQSPGHPNGIYSAAEMFVEINDDDDPLRAVIEAMIASKAMDDKAVYLSRGRQHASLPLEDLRTLWTEAFKALFYSRPKVSSTPMDDVAAELALRGEDPPYDRMPLEIDSIYTVISAQSDDYPAIGAPIRAFLKLMANPKN